MHRSSRVGVRATVIWPYALAWVDSNCLYWTRCLCELAGPSALPPPMCTEMRARMNFLPCRDRSQCRTESPPAPRRANQHIRSMELPSMSRKYVKIKSIWEDVHNRGATRFLQSGNPDQHRQTWASTSDCAFIWSRMVCAFWVAASMDSTALL